MTIYTVKPNDTIDSIAASFAASPEKIAYDNQIPYPYALAVGQSLLIDSNESFYTGKSIYSGGYAYPFISPWVLENTLPYLTDLYIFSYGFSAKGELIPPIIDEKWMIYMAKNYNVRPILTLTPLDSSGSFNNNLITSVVNNSYATDNLINNLINQLNTFEYMGVDIDFEYIKEEDKDAFSSFVASVTSALNEYGYIVSVALAPKTSSTQAGLLYAGKDYRALGKAANYVLLMTYEWGYKYGPPMAVAPINKVRQVLDYAVTEIAPQKIHLGIPNYGYDWALPFIKGKSAATTIGNIEAVQIAINNNAAISFDDTAKSPFFEYSSNFQTNEEHIVWFEDVKSYNAKFGLINEYNLRGMSVWHINRFFNAGWLLLNDTFTLQRD